MGDKIKKETKATKATTPTTSTTKPKVPIKPKADKTELEALGIEAQIVELFPPWLVETLKRIVYEVSVIGMPEDEACLIVGYEHKELTALKEKHPIVNRLFEMKNLEYKRNLVKVVSEKARRGDDKLSQWLLEARYPNEYNRKKGTGGDNSDNESALAAAVEFVQETVGTDGLVKKTAGRALIVKGGRNGNAPMSVTDSLVGRAEEIVEKIKHG